MWQKTIAISTLIRLLAWNGSAFAREKFTPINTPTVDGKYVVLVNLGRDVMIEGYRQQRLKPCPRRKM